MLPCTRAPWPGSRPRKHYKDQEETVWRVLEIRCKELMQEDETERKRSAHVDEPTRPPESPRPSDNSHPTNLLGCKKPSKMVPPPHLAPGQNVLDVANLAKEVSPTDTNFDIRLKCHAKKVWCSARFLRRASSSVSEPNIRLTLKPNRRRNPASVYPNRAPSLTNRPKRQGRFCTMG